MAIDPIKIGLLIIGDEILSGKRQDRHFPKAIEIVRARGLSLSWNMYLPDDPEMITEVLSERDVDEFRRLSGVGAVLNTSFNIQEPIVCTPEQAYRCFMATNMDVLVVENFVLLKKDQTNAQVNDREDYLAQFDLD